MFENAMQIYEGMVVPGHQMASGEAIGRAERPSPFPQGTVRMQHPHFAERGVDLSALIPEMVWGTINVKVTNKLIIDEPSVTLELVDWTSGTSGKQIEPETFCFAPCMLLHDGGLYEAMVYYPAPWTKPAEVAHDYNVIELLAAKVPGLTYGDAVVAICPARTFRPYVSEA